MKLKMSYSAALIMLLMSCKNDRGNYKIFQADFQEAKTRWGASVDCVSVGDDCNLSDYVDGPHIIYFDERATNGALVDTIYVPYSNRATYQENIEVAYNGGNIEELANESPYLQLFSKAPNRQEIIENLTNFNYKITEMGDKDGFVVYTGDLLNPTFIYCTHLLEPQEK